MLLFGLVASAVLHILAFAVVSFSIDPAERALRPPPIPVRIQPEMKAYDLITVTFEVPSIEVQLRERELVREQLVAPGIDAPALPAGLSGAPPPPSDPMRGRLEYRMGAVEVWRPPVEAIQLSAEENARNRVAARLDAYNDSVAAEAAARAKANDWTVKTADGGRWGATPDSIYVGDVALANRFQLATPAGRRDEIAGRVRTWGEIQQQVVRVEGDMIIGNRVKAIRARMDAERAKRLAATPDTVAR